MAGATNAASSSHYLYTNQAYWLVSPYRVDTAAREFLLDASGRLSSNFVNNSYGIRPVISVRSNLADYFFGSGTWNDPYSFYLLR